MKKFWILVLTALFFASYAAPCRAVETENANTEAGWFPPETTVTTTISFPTVTTAETTTAALPTETTSAGITFPVENTSQTTIITLPSDLPTSEETTTAEQITDTSSSEELTIIPMPIETTASPTDTTAATSATTADSGFLDLLFTDYLVYFVIGVCVVLVAVTVIVCILVAGRNRYPRQMPAAHKKISIRVEFGPSLGKAYDFLDSFCIGRDKNRCELVLPMDVKGADAVHARVFADAKGVHLIDLGSSCGTFLEDGTRLEAGREYLLISGSRFYIGDRKNFFTVRF